VGQILVGITSWTEPSLISCRRFYPPDARTAESFLFLFNNCYTDKSVTNARQTRLMLD
jgi:hypothetical protein